MLILFLKNVSAQTQLCEILDPVNQQQIFKDEIQPFSVSLLCSLVFQSEHFNCPVVYTGRSLVRQNQLFREKTPQNKTDTVFTDFAKCIYEHAAYETKVTTKWVEAFQFESS